MITWPFLGFACASAFGAVTGGAESPSTHNSPASYYEIEGVCRKKPINQITDPGTGGEIYNDFEIIEQKELKVKTRPCSAVEATTFLDFQEYELKKTPPMVDGYYENSKKVDVTVDAKSLTLLKCAVLEAPSIKSKLALARFRIKAPTPKRIKGFSILSVLHLGDNAKPDGVLKRYLNVESIYDLVHNSDVYHVCDLDGDGFPEVIIKNEGYAGYNFSILKISNDFKKVTEENVQGATGD